MLTRFAAPNSARSAPSFQIRAHHFLYTRKFRALHSVINRCIFLVYEKRHNRTHALLCLYHCNWLTFYSPYSFASQAFTCFAPYSTVISITHYYIYCNLFMQNILFFCIIFLFLVILHIFILMNYSAPVGFYFLDSLY